MRRTLAIAALIAIASIVFMAGSEQQAAADSYRRGQSPIAGYATMQCSTMHHLAVDAVDTINAPEGYRITRYEIWNAHSHSQIMNLKFFMNIGSDSTDVDIRMWSPGGELVESPWRWRFPVSCERIIMVNGTFEAAWCSCVYLMRYGEGAGIAGKTHAWR